MVLYFFIAISFGVMASNSLSSLSAAVPPSDAGSTRARIRWTHFFENYNACSDYPNLRPFLYALGIKETFQFEGEVN